mmetsp:Transcript_96256/g.165964  ORF Transcript_96256/g.165964 Transcript_96256/m.165964 type:complete len:251 (-) Transcript_96256:3-755(-)
MMLSLMGRHNACGGRRTVVPIEHRPHSAASQPARGRHPRGAHPPPPAGLPPQPPTVQAMLGVRPPGLLPGLHQSAAGRGRLPADADPRGGRGDQEQAPTPPGPGGGPHARVCPRVLRAAHGPVWGGPYPELLLPHRTRPAEPGAGADGPGPGVHALPIPGDQLHPARRGEGPLPGGAEVRAGRVPDPLLKRPPGPLVRDHWRPLRRGAGQAVRGGRGDRDRGHSPHDLQHQRVVRLPGGGAPPPGRRTTL